MPWRCEAASGQAVLNKPLHNTRAWRVEVTPEDPDPLPQGEGTRLTR